MILDEPTAGLDPEERLRLYNSLGDLSAERVVLLSTHIVDDAEQLCPEVAVIVGGKIRVRGATAALVEVLDGQVWQAMGSVEPSGKAMLLNTAYSRGNRVRRYHCEQRPGPDFETVRPTLEDRYFLELRRAEGRCMLGRLHLRNEWRLLARHPLVWLALAGVTGFAGIIASGSPGPDGSNTIERLLRINLFVPSFILPFLAGAIGPIVFLREAEHGMREIVGSYPITLRD